MFVANFDVITARVSADGEILIVSGTDHIYLPMLGEAEPHCARDRVTERDRRAA